MESQGLTINGYCASGAEAIVEAFANNFSEHGEKGAALTVYKQGEMLVNLWAGTRDRGDSIAWESDTRVNIFSAGKPLVAVCVLQLAAQGKLDLDKPIADYWPEFAQAGKETITPKQVLCHRSGVSAFKRVMDDDLIFDWPRVTDAIAAAEPWWEPNSAQGYAPFLYGWLLGELVRRVSGCESFDEYFQREIAQPLGLNVKFGVPSDELSALADVAALPAKLQSAGKENGKGNQSLVALIKSDPRGVANRAFANPTSLLASTNSTRWRQAQIPAANGHASAESLARFYAALAGDGSWEGNEVLPQEYLSWCSEQQSAEEDKVLATHLRFSLGFLLAQPHRDDCRFGSTDKGFGHPGAGGCLGFADPEAGIGFGYVTNRMGQSILIEPRARRLIDAVYGCC